MEPGAASYSRYSSEQQDERSIPDQQRKCRSRAAIDGLEIAAHLEFADKAISGAKHDRAGFEALMLAARRGLINVVYFENLSRLARDCVLTLQTLRELVHVLKIRIVSIDEGIDSAASDSWELLAAILGIQNEQFLRSLAQFVFRGQEGAVIDRLCVGDYCFGYKSEPIAGSEKERRGRHPKPKKRYIIQPEEAAWVKMIFHWFVVEKRSLRWIAAELNKQGAPKDHRASTPHWYHQLLPGLLRNRKYIGLWPWGEKKNVRDPLTGKIRQEKRPAHKTEKWLRHFPELQIIDDDAFAKAQVRLKASADAVALRNAKKEQQATDKRRRRNKEFVGSTKQTAEMWPRHLLANLIECADCGRRLYVGGGNGKYLFCPNYRMGVCPCGTSLQRKRAEKMILDAIGAEVLNDAELLELVLSAARAAWEQLERQLPSERAAAETSLAEVEGRIARLIDQCEKQDVPELAERLRKRRGERDALKAKLARLEEAALQRSQPPSDEWIHGQIEDLRSLLAGGDPAAALALRKLVGGKIVVTEVRRDGKQRHYLRGELCVRFRDIADSIGATVKPGLSEGEQPPDTVIVIDFREPEDHEVLAESVKADFDAGMKFKEIAAKHGCGRPLVARAFAHWHHIRELSVPDARGLRHRLKGQSRLSQVLLQKVMNLWDQDLLIDKIAEALGCSRDVVRVAVKAWHVARGLPVPDGRRRRRQIRLKRERPTDDLQAG